MPYIIDFCRLLLLGSSQEFIMKMEIKILITIVSLLRTIQIDDNMLNDIEYSGYMAPEYAMLGQFSVKSDVFSFGVLILEVLSGQKITCFQNGDNAEYLLSYVSMTTKYKADISILFIVEN